MAETTRPVFTELNDYTLARLSVLYRTRIAAFTEAADTDRQHLARLAAVQEQRAGGLNILTPISASEPMEQV